MLKNGLYLSLVFFFTACGGGASQHEPREEKTLYFVDAPSNGIDYQCGERSGVTKTYTQNSIVKHGLFKCVYSPIKFSLGKLHLGDVDAVVHGQTIYPQTLVSSFNGDFNNEEVLKIAIVLQSLDDKSNPNYINIPQSSKDKITLTSLKDISILELNEAIINMGFTPVSKEDAKVHLILNSPNAQSGKPKVEVFEEEISLDLTVGNVIGELNINKGDGDLNYPFILKGEGQEYFLLNNKGKLILTESFNTPKSYELNVTVSNEFGYTTVPLNIHVKDTGKIGKAQMGRLKGATVKIFKLLENGQKELLTTETSNSTGSLNLIGNFDLHTELLEDHSFYIYEISGGEDIDIDDNAEEDATSTKNHGVMHLISKGIWIKNANQKIRVTPLSEILYTYLERDGFSDLENALTKYAQILLKTSLKTSLNNDEKINAKDIMHFNPLKDKTLLYDTLTYNNTYNNIVHQLRAGNSTYKKSIFNAYVVESFQSNAIEIVGSSIYTIDMTGTGEFNIYDLETKEKIGGMKLPNAPFEEDTHVLYVNLLRKEITISSLKNHSYELNIQNQGKPIFLRDPFTSYATISGNFSRLTIGRSLGGDLFSKERRTYFYNMITQNNTSKQVKVFNTTEDDNILLYEFDSKVLNIESFWSYGGYLYIVGDNIINIFQERNDGIYFEKNYTNFTVTGDILGIEGNILYLLDKQTLKLLDISSQANLKLIENLNVPFKYKLGVKTNGNYITTGSKIIDIKSLRASTHSQ